MSAQSRRKRLMLVGDWKRPQYESALAAGFTKLGWHVLPFKITDYLGEDFFSRVEKKLLLGPNLFACNQALLQELEANPVDAILFFKPIYIFESTVQNIRTSKDAILLSQCNDNPYEDGNRLSLWRHYHRVIRHCDLNFFSRPSDLSFAAKENIRNPRWLKFFYCDGIHCRPERIQPQFRNEVVFIGHFEPDGRDETLEFLLQNGVPLRVFGTEWHRAPAHALLSKQNLTPLYDSNYVQALAGAKISLVFLSHRNRDHYTSRCFEIPACGSLMIAPRTPILQNLYKEDSEAVFYETKEELLDKIRFYLLNSRERVRIAEAGMKRCLAGANSNLDRAAELVRAIEAFAFQSRETSAKAVEA